MIRAFSSAFEATIRPESGNARRRAVSEGTTTETLVLGPSKVRGRPIVMAVSRKGI
jgi:hypothetical protein